MKISGMSIFGFVVFGLGSFGVYNAVQNFGKPEVKKRDVSTTGIITRIHGTEIKNSLTKIKLNSQFNIDYKFTAENGQEYSDSSIINESQFHSLKEGDKVGVRYQSHNPTLCASEYGHYTPVAGMPKSTPLLRLLFSLGLSCFGGLILFLTFRENQQKQESSSEFATQFKGAYNSQMG